MAPNKTPHDHTPRDWAPERRPIAWIGRHPRLIALGLGALAATGFPPLSLWPVALLAMGAAALMFRAARNMRQAALSGWLFGVAHFTLANNWIATAFTHQAKMPAFLGWLAVPLLALYLAVYPALAAAVARRFFARGGVLVFALGFAGLWTVAEWLRSWVFTGYAWGPFSLTLLGPMARPGLALALPWTGSYALSAFAVLAGIALVTLLIRRRWIGALGLGAALAAGMYLPQPAPMPGPLRYTLVQPNLTQEQLEDPRQYEPAFLTLAALSARPAAAPPDNARRVVLWPESGLPDYLRPGYPERYYLGTTAGGDPGFARHRVGRVIGPNSRLLTGATDLEIAPGPGGWPTAIAAYNVVTALDPRGEIVGSFAKAHLVPYGEYLPMRSLLEPLGAGRLVSGALDFLPGPGPRTLDMGAYGRVGPQICYEIVFSGQVVDRDDRPDYIFNPSNDAWFGAWGPPQFFAQARLRAIEEGLPVLRATTTGISGVIDANGVVRGHLGHGERAALNGSIPRAKTPTLFARLGNLLALAWAAVLIVVAVVVIARRRR